MKRIIATALAAGLLLGLTACGNFPTTPSEIKKQHQFVEACEKAGGKTFRGAFDNVLKCNIGSDV